MTFLLRGYILSALCFTMVAGCGPHFKDASGERLSLAGYDCVSVRPVEVAARIARANLAEDLTAEVRDRLTDSEVWEQAAIEPAPADENSSADAANAVDAADVAVGRQIDLTVTVIKAKYPSRSKIIWLGSAHKMTCRLQLHDHATGELLGSAKASVSIEPLLGNAAVLNAGAVGVLARTAIDRRKHDARSLLEHMAEEIVETLDRAKE